MTWSELANALIARGLAAPAAGSTRQASPGASSHEAVGGVAYDSRRVEPGQVFVAVRGQRADGAAFIAEAIARGAVAIVSEQAPAQAGAVPWMVVKDARVALSALAAAFYRQPSASLRVVGITGTNGKTTTAHLVAAMFEAAGLRCGNVGTVAYRVGRDARAAARTTPEAPDLQGLLREMVDTGHQACAMEVSSHALALHRVADVQFAAGVYSNLTRDHLDFHADMEAYFRAKRRLFEMLPRTAPSVINLDDPRGPALVEIAGRPVTYAVNRTADVTPGPASISLEGLAFDIRTPHGLVQARSRLVGRPNVYNILAAVGAATALGLPLDAVERGLQSLDGVSGRFQIVSGKDDEVTVVVDYAHTDDALRNLLETARPMTWGRLITVFGCGGERDRTKRPLMGAVATRLSDVVVMTSDNPRDEDPERIIEEIRRGITEDTRRDASSSVLTIVDRGAAIERAIELARRGDLVLLAGKGHEKYQVIRGQDVPFDDVAVAREALARRRSRSGVA